MKELDLNDLSSDAVDPILAVLNILTGEQEDVHIYRGEDYLYTIHKAAEREIAPGLIKGNYQKDDKPSEVVRAIRKNLVPEEEYQAMLVEKEKNDQVEVEADRIHGGCRPTQSR